MSYLFDDAIQNPIQSLSPPCNGWPQEWQAGINIYAVDTSGDCLHPVYESGSVLICDPDQKPKPGDFVVIWWKGGERPPSVKRLVMALPPKDVSGGLESLLVFEQLNPPKVLSAPFSRVEAVHKVLGEV